MSVHELAGYTLRVTKVRESTPLPLENFDGSGGDLLVFLHAYFQGLQAHRFLDEHKKKALRTAGLSTDRRRLDVITQGGDYGFESVLENVDTGIVTANRTVDDVEMVPIRTSVLVPMTRATGLMLTERVQRRGILSMFAPTVKRTFRSIYSGYVLHIEAVAPADAFAQILADGQVRKVRLAKHVLPADIADRFGLSNRAEVGDLELVLKIPRGFFPKDRLLDFVSETASRGGYVSVGGEEYDSVKVEVHTPEGKVRTLNVSTGRAPAATWDYYDGDLTPTDEFVREVCTGLMEEMAPSLGMTGALSQHFDWTPSMLDLVYEIPEEEADGEDA